MLPAASLAPPKEELWLTMDDQSDDDDSCGNDDLLVVVTQPSQGPSHSCIRSGSPLHGGKVLNPVCLEDSPSAAKALTRAAVLRNKAIQRQKQAAALARQQMTPRGTQPRPTLAQDKENLPPMGRLAKLRKKLPSRKSKRATGFEHGVRGDRVLGKHR